MQEAFQSAGLVVIPVVALVVTQAGGVVVLSPALLLAGGALLWAVAALVLRAGTRAMSRAYLGERL